MTSLAWNTEYTITAYSDSGCSTALTPGATVTTLAPALASSNVGATAATLTLSNWDITKDGNWRFKSTAQGATCSSAQTSLTATATGLSNNTAYTYKAYNTNNCSGTAIATATAFTTVTPALTSSLVGATAARLTLSNWNTTSDGSWYYKAATGPHTSCSSAVTTRTTDVTGLSNATAYTYTAYSNSGCSTTIDAAPAFTTTTPSLSSTATSNSVTLTISGWNITTDGYWYIQINQISSDCSLAINPNFTITSLQPSTSYTFRGFSDNGCANAITALHTKSTTAQSNNQIQQFIQEVEETKETPAAPGAVSGLSAAHGGSSVTASWNAAARATGYDVVYSTDGMYTWTRAATNRSGTSYTLTGADSSKDYVFAVRAVNAGGASGWTNSPPAEAPTPPPGAVSEVHVTHNAGTVTASWSSADGATGYDVVYSTDGRYTWTRASTNQSTTSYTLNGADSSKNYVFSVRAVNEAGASGWTNSAAASYAGPPQYETQEVTAQSVQGANAPSAPSYVGASHHGGWLNSTWTKVSGATGYEWRYRTNDKDGGNAGSWSSTITLSSNQTSYTRYSGVTSASAYEVSVRAVGSSNQKSGWTTSLVVWYVTGGAGGAGGGGAGGA